MHNVTNALMTTAEAADLLGVSTNSVNRWARLGTLPPVVQGPGIRGARLFDRAEVERFARNRTQAA